MSFIFISEKRYNLNNFLLRLSDVQKSLVFDGLPRFRTGLHPKSETSDTGLFFGLTFTIDTGSMGGDECSVDDFIGMFS
jgi:hypothetical protein